MIRKSLIALSVATGACIGLPALAADQPELHQQGGFDMAIADEHKLISMLKQSGKIAQNATLNEAEQALANYLRERQEQERVRAGSVSDEAIKQFGLGSKNHFGGALQNGGGNKLGIGKHNKPAPMVLENYEGEQRTAKILAILMEFPDFPHNSIQPGETGMYYADYTPAHYSSLMFGQSGWTGPAGQNFVSMKQYYEAQSGNSYSVEGQVAGWYMAQHNAAYYGGNPSGNIRALVREALAAAAADPSVDMSQFDIEDRYDLDGDGNVWEPDGLVDHVMIIHSSVGEEAGGGQLGEDAIWSHRWNLGSVFGIPGTSTPIPYWGGAMGAFDYTVQPADGAVGVFAHEYGHDLGLPDEYDTQYTGRGEPVSSWSIMSSGSWAGVLGGTEPTGFSAWAKEFLSNRWGLNWLSGSTIHFNDIPADGITGLLDQAVSKGTNNDAIRIDLPDKENIIVTPTSGQYAYHGGSGNNLRNQMYMPLDLSSASSASVSFKAWFDIEADWDYGYVMVYNLATDTTEPVAGNITTNSNPNGQNFGNGITGQSGGWVDASFDLSAYAGQQVYLMFYYWTDGYVANPGLYIDDVQVSVDANSSADNAEGAGLFTLDGFTKDTGKFTTPHYYLVEWRNHQGVDQGLKHINVAGKLMEFNEGLLVWYVDPSFDNNWVGVHPGDGFLGVVDADRHTNLWSGGDVASTRYQIHDAAFNLDKSAKLTLDLKDAYDLFLRDNFTKRNPVFDDSTSFISADIPDAGRNVPNYGLKIRVVSQSDDKSVGQILIYK